MTTTYYAYETVSKAPTFPAWLNMWPGQDGCSARQLSYSAYTPNQPPNPGLPKYYEPLETSSWRVGQNNSGITRSIPPYRHTKYSVGKRTIKRHLIRIHRGSRGVNQYYQFGHVAKVVTTCTPFIDNVTCSGPVWSTYDEVSRDFYYLNTYVRSALSAGEVHTALNEVQNEMTAESAVAYDVLTDVAEAREIPRMIRSIAEDLLKILRTLKSRFGKNVMSSAQSLSPLDLLRHPERWLRKFGDEWMTYRYGIMPLVYSYRDLMKNLNRGQEVKTRKSRNITPAYTNQSLPAPNTRYWVKDTVGSVHVRGTVFQHFTSDEVARLSGIGSNPLVTAWELIPYSFVIDWFVNVGDYIAARTCQTWAQKQWACLSRRDKYTNQTWLHLAQDDCTVVIDNMLPSGWWNANGNPAPTPNQVMSNPEGLYIFDEEEVDSYDRWPVYLSAAPLQYNPSLNWRRLVDSAVMSNNLLGRFMRSFR